VETIKNPINLFWLCMLGHLISDFYLQGILCDLKQKEWWEEQLKKLIYKTNNTEVQHKLFTKYKHDYIAGLLCHALMWSLVTFLPLMLVCGARLFSCVVEGNFVLHAVVDNMKANTHSINLVQDQLIHLLQVEATVVLVCYTPPLLMALGTL